MAKYQCDACEALREKDPNLIINGFSDENCESLANGTGLNGEGDNFEDLNDLNDCLVGSMEADVKTYESCDWKTFMRRFIPNLWATLKAIICSLEHCMKSEIRVERQTIPASTIATNTSKAVNWSFWPGGTNRKIIGVAGYNFNDATPDAPGTAGVAHFNVFAVEPDSQNDLGVYIQFRNKSSNDVNYILSITVQYIET